MYQRILQLNKLLEQKSHFLLGPRATGKTTLIRQQLSGNVEVLDLLERDTYKRLLQDPSILERINHNKIIVIDEIQKIPTLLDEVHRLIEKQNRTFLLTGSSARKLRKQGTNLLAGRAWQTSLTSLVSKEIPKFDLEQYLTRGGLPQVYDSIHWDKELRAYISLYLREEVSAEALTRNLEAFSEFLDLVAKSNGHEINYQNFASDCGVSLNTIKNYFEILEDTLIGIKVPAFTKTKKRKAITRSKHYLFDIGIVNSLCEQKTISTRTPAFGSAFEHFIFLELRAANIYLDYNQSLNYWRSTSQQEVDFIFGNKTAIEVKAVERVQDKHLKGIRALMEEGLMNHYIVVSLDPYNQVTHDGINCLYWEDFLDLLWNKKL